MGRVSRAVGRVSWVVGRGSWVVGRGSCIVPNNSRHALWIVALRKDSCSLSLKAPSPITVFTRPLTFM